MKTLLYSLVAAVALTLGGVFTSSAVAGYPGHGQGHNHGHHGHSQGHYHYHNGHYDYYPGPHYGGGYGGGYYGGYRPVYPYYYPQNNFYYRGQNFGVRIGF